MFCKIDKNQIEKEKMNKKEKTKLFLTALLILLLALPLYGTIAYFTAEEIAHNVITTGEIDIELLEWADTDKTIPFSEKVAENVLPGSDIIKIVEVKNTGENQAYIRIKVDKAITLQGNEKPDLNLIKLDFNNKNWTLGLDGFYYYNEKLKSGEKTKPLFTTLHFDISMDNIYQKSNIEVEITAYATQVANNGDSVMEAKGWPQPKESNK